MSGDELYISAPLFGIWNRGRVFRYRHQRSSGTWTQEYEYRVNDHPADADNQWYQLGDGLAVDFERGWVLAGASGYSFNGLPAVGGLFIYGNSIGTVIYDSSGPNSSGDSARISLTGSRVVADQSAWLHARGLPPGDFGVLLGGDTSFPYAFGSDLLVLANPQRVTPILVAGASGDLFHELDWQTPWFLAHATAGNSKNFQYVYRDSGGAVAETRTGEAVRVTFE